MSTVNKAENKAPKLPLSPSEYYTRYTYRTVWHEPDQEYLTTCADYPGLSYLDADPVASFQGFLEVVKGAIALTLEDGLPVPEPIQTRTFNGKVTLRIPPELHKEWVLEAAEAQVSLNRYLSNKLVAK